MKSRHLTGYAVDVFAYPTPSGVLDWKWYEMIARAFKAASLKLSIFIEWGGDWKSLKGGVHFQLTVNDYPA